MFACCVLCLTTVVVGLNDCVYSRKLLHCNICAVPANPVDCSTKQTLARHWTVAAVGLVLKSRPDCVVLFMSISLRALIL